MNLPGRESAGYFEEDPCSNPHARQTIGEIISRRKALKSAGAVLAGGFLARWSIAEKPQRDSTSALVGDSSLAFHEIAHGNDVNTHVAHGYAQQVLLRWGDAVVTGAPKFDVFQQTAEAQSKQFGYNCDFIGFLPLPHAADGSKRGLLCVNHEYTDTNLMFPGI
ncbi:MAG: DUF839 domain-containing protein, partial [Planctomycetales bacterium]